MAAKMVDLTNAVLAVLNAGSFSQDFTAVKEYVPLTAVRELTGLKVCVVPASLESEIYSRGSTKNECAINVGVIQKVSTDSDTEALMELMEEIDSYLKTTKFAGVVAAWSQSKIAAIYDAQTLREHRTFLSVLTVTYVWGAA